MNLKTDAAFFGCFYLCKVFDMYKYFKQEFGHDVAVTKGLYGQENYNICLIGLKGKTEILRNMFVLDSVSLCSLASLELTV